MIKMIFMISAATQSFPSFGGVGVVHKNQTNHSKITVQTTDAAHPLLWRGLGRLLKITVQTTINGGSRKSATE
jgi:hypothetical protein